MVDDSTYRLQALNAHILSILVATLFSLMILLSHLRVAQHSLHGLGVCAERAAEELMRYRLDLMSILVSVSIITVTKMESIRCRIYCNTRTVLPFYSLDISIFIKDAVILLVYDN